MLNIIEEKNKIDAEVHQTVLNKISNADGFIVLSIEKGQLQWNRYQLDSAETLYLLEWAKLRLMADAGI